LGFFALQAVGCQELAWREPLQKKSRLKTSRRFLVFGRMCHNLCVNYENVQSGNGPRDSVFPTICSVVPPLFHYGAGARRLCHIPSDLNPRQSDLIPPNPTNGKK
jgi:hypothetical protein